jgi:hypothetical protein
MKREPDGPPMLYESTLLKRGWSKALVAELLGEPDKLGINPHYKSGPPTRLYLQSRVEEAERSPKWISSQEGRDGRREAAALAVKTKTETLMAQIEQLVVRLPRLDNDELMSLAVRNKNTSIPDWVIERGDARFAVLEDLHPWPDYDEFRDRICVNFLRHGATSYDRVLRGIYGRVAKREAHRRLSKKIYDAIAEAYPMLAREAHRQYESRWPASA